MPPVPVDTQSASSDKVAGGVSLPRLKGQGFYSRFGKRLLDLGLAVVGLVLLSPLFGLCAVAIKLSSPGPVFFWQHRIGRDARPFRIAKFRSMVTDAERVGPAITASGDPRVTRIGAFLRRLKIDELPQLWNVLKGEMSLVGPRPELPEYVARYTLQQRQVLHVRPGITDIASLHYRCEEEVMRRDPDPEQFYRETVLPHKLALNLDYIERMSFSYDVYLISRTVVSLFIPALKKRTKPK